MKIKVILNRETATTLVARIGERIEEARRKVASLEADGLFSLADRHRERAQEYESLLMGLAQKR